ncbi:MAG: hypothetical protein KC910_06695 [Candidatus Eremiobacteraeota bacterium]|nr:hypothetical protein [Candidatus Eremiobacteraeota bacterium]
MAKRKILLGLFGLACLWTAINLYRTYSWPAERVRPSQQNAVWLGHRWLTPQTDVAQLASRVQEHGLGYLFVHAGPLDWQGKVAPLPAEWDGLAQLRRHCPEARIYAWLGGLNADFLGQAEDTVDLSSARVRANIVATGSRLVEAGFDGIHYDLEPVREGDPNFLALLRESREAGLLVSVATPQVRPPGLPLPQLWSQDYYIRVGGLVDQVVLMGYDTCQPSQDLYTRYLAYQVQQVGTVSCQFLLGLPTYQDNAPYHNPAHETLAAGLAAAGPADGVAIYAYWTTAEADWRTIDGERRKSRQ